MIVALPSSSTTILTHQSLFTSFALAGKMHCSLVTAAFGLLIPLIAGLDESSLTKFTNTLTLEHSFKPVKESYWTGFPHHRRTPFAVSPDGSSAYIAYLDSTETNVYVQKLDPSTFAAAGSAVTVTGAKEAGGLVAHDDGFALLTNEALPSGTTNAPAGSTPVPVLYRYTNGQQTWKTFLGGPNVHTTDGLSASPDLNGDLAYSESSKMYGAYFVVTDYQGWAAGHFGDSIQYVADDGTLQTIAGASSSWGCSHNTGIAFEAADQPPFASICAEDQGAIWLNTKTQTMDGVKISNENVTNGGSGEPMGGMSGSYSGLARFQNSNAYIFSWVSRGAINLHQNEWLGGDNTQAFPRTTNRNVAIATFSDKNTLNGPEAISVVGAASGDDQVNWITTGTADRSNAHVATFDASNALVTWEEITQPTCNFIAMGCSGTFTGSYFQQVDSSGAKVGEALQSLDTYVAGDMVTFSDGRICWPYVDMAWSLAANAPKTSVTTSMSFACISLSGTGASPSSGSGSSSSAAPTSASTSVATSSALSSGIDISLTATSELTSVIAIPTVSSTVRGDETSTTPSTTSAAVTSTGSSSARSTTGLTSAPTSSANVNTSSRTTRRPRPTSAAASSLTTPPLNSAFSASTSKAQETPLATSASSSFVPSSAASSAEPTGTLTGMNFMCVEVDEL